MKKDLKVFLIDADTSINRIETYKIGEFFGPVDLGLHLSKKYQSTNIGTGLFADSTLTGSNRLLFTGETKCWDGFYISAMGGAGLIFDSLDVSVLSIMGKASSPSVLYLNHTKNGKIESQIDPINVDKIWSEGEGGVYSLMDYMIEKYGDRYEKEPRILATGLSALSTDFGAVCSAPIKKGIVTPVDTWAGRGGFGSKLAREHGIVAVIYGGVTTQRGFRDRKLIDSWFEEKYETTFAKKDHEVSLKYNYIPVLNTGGTLGVNYATLGADMLSFNYASIYNKEENRLKVHDEFVTKHYLKQFNKESMLPNTQKNCGEPCGTKCKKMNGKFKKDYEPYQAMGPLCGIFDQRAAEKLNRYSDSLGFDAISMGGVLSWMMELLVKGYVSKEDFAVSAIPKFDDKEFDIVETSIHNANIGVELLDAIVYKKGLIDLSEGARVFAHNLAKLRGDEVLNSFIYNANGKQGWMVPNQYWTPGVLSPMALMGKYYMYYGQDFVPPRELGHKNAERFRAELMIDNIGVCRFHRGWAEEMTPEIINNLYNKKDEFLASLNKLAVDLNEQGKPVFWESERNIDMMHEFLKKKESIKYANELQTWKEAFAKDKHKAAKSFWSEIYKGAQEKFKMYKERNEEDFNKKASNQ